MMERSRIAGVSMAGWISFVLAAGTVTCMIMKLPMDTQFFTIVNSVLVAYVAKNRPGTSEPPAKPRRL